MTKPKKGITKVIPDETVIRKIYLFCGEKVIPDSDLAELYGVETKYLKRQVIRNIERFPDDFMFELTSREYQSLRSQFGTLKRGAHSKYLAYAFTEQGVAMLSSVINSPKAIDMNIAIMRASVEMRKFLNSNKKIGAQIKTLFEKVGGHDAHLKGIYDAIENLLDEKAEKKGWEERERIGFKK
jgi:ORF6N domain